MFTVFIRNIFTILGICTVTANASAENVTYNVSLTADTLFGGYESAFSTATVTGTIVLDQAGEEVDMNTQLVSAELDVTIDGLDMIISTTTLQVYGNTGYWWQIGSGTNPGDRHLTLPWQRFNEGTGWAMAGECTETLYFGACYQNAARSGNISLERLVAERLVASRSFRPDAYTAAPDVRPGNFATCDGRTWVPGFKVAGQLFIQHKYSDKCFDEEVTFLPEGLWVYDRAAVTRFIGQPIDFYYWQ